MSVLQLARTVWGITELVCPETLVRAGAGRDPDECEVSAVRVLGARDVLQAQVTTRRGEGAHRAGACVDLLHAASMIAVASRSPRHKRLALTSAAIALAFALAERAAARRAARIAALHEARLAAEQALRVERAAHKAELVEHAGAHAAGDSE